MEASKANFPKRNRIVSGLADVILVVEAEYRSGTSITAKFAKEQGKTVCCLPSNVDSRCGLGTNRLIKEGAKLIVKPLELMKIISENKEDDEKNIQENNSDKIKLPKEYEEIYKIVQPKPIHINDICKTLNKDIAQISPILTMMELEEYIEQLPGNQFKVKED